jgi:prevent-host-death family protein
MKIAIGAYEAKTKLPELLRQVREGKRFTITNRGEAVADLVPSEDAQPGDPRGAIEKFRAFIRANPIKGRTNIKALIREGRE